MTQKNLIFGTKLIAAVENLSYNLGYSEINSRSTTAVEFFKKIIGFLLQFTDPIVTSGDEERIISLKFIDPIGKTRAIRRLTHEFHVGDVVIVGVSVPVVGEYHEGGGWIFSGRKYFGKFGVAGDVTNVTSSSPEVVSTTVNQTGGWY